MIQPSSDERIRRRSFLIAFFAVASLPLSSPHAAAGTTILFTASTDITGGHNPSAPNDHNMYIPDISPGVKLSPDPAYLNNQDVGPIDGIKYGPSFTQVPNVVTGTTGWVSSTVTIQASGQYRLIWEVANTINAAGQDALATDNIRLGGNSLFQFNDGIPMGFTKLGSYGTSAGVTGLSPSGKDEAFAWLDVLPSPHATKVTPLFDPSYTTGLGDGYSASRLYSSVFTATKGQTLMIDTAFLTNDGGNYADYGIVALQSVPEPSSLILAALGGIGVGGHCLRRHLTRSRRWRNEPSGIRLEPQCRS
jgi:PEP-CTERM motif-containing protein